MSFIDWLIARTERWRLQNIIWTGRTPNGWRVVLTDTQLDHIRHKHAPYATLDMIIQCVTQPTAIYRDVRPLSYGRKFFIVRQLPDPYGKIKIKHFNVEVKRCVKFGVIPVMYVSTAHKLSRLHEAKGQRIWTGLPKNDN